MASSIHVYGTDWCGLTFRLREYLTRERFSYDYHDIERDRDAADFVQSVNSGSRRFPIVVVEDTVAISPTIGTLRQLIDECDVQPTASRSPRSSSISSNSEM